MILFFVGIIEMLIVTAWTNAVTRTKVLMSGSITFVNVLIWYYVLQTIVDNISNWHIAALYAAGCAAGTILATAFVAMRDAKNKGIAREHGADSVAMSSNAAR